MTTVIEIEQLARYFGPVKALDRITFCVEEGEVFGWLGTNGAGKTTTVGLLNGVLTPSYGQNRVLVFDPVTQMIQQLSHQKGWTVCLCTHNLSEAQRFFTIGFLEHLSPNQENVIRHVETNKKKKDIEVSLDKWQLSQCSSALSFRCIFSTKKA